MELWDALLPLADRLGIALPAAKGRGLAERTDPSPALPDSPRVSAGRQALLAIVEMVDRGRDSEAALWAARLGDALDAKAGNDAALFKLLTDLRAAAQSPLPPGHG